MLLAASDLSPAWHGGSDVVGLESALMSVQLRFIGLSIIG